MSRNTFGALDQLRVGRTAHDVFRVPCLLRRGPAPV